MTLDELFPQCGLSLDAMPHLIIEVPVDLLEAAGVRLDESKWQDAHISGMKYRVDPERPDMKQKRHVHVAAAKHVNTPTRQASWNDDGRRHDKKNFNAALGAQAKYRDVAQRALGLDANVVLEAIEPKRASAVTVILESAADPDVEAVAELHLRATAPRPPLKRFSEFFNEG